MCGEFNLGWALVGFTAGIGLMTILILFKPPWRARIIDRPNNGLPSRNHN